ncbi:hypothetical protein TIFTF001_018372 [Ficus carica]|uniref:Uncharacterized protein n=1 Tax=Ficus carica TaxID=3494 RepID=A0AA88A6Y0_FICCA|nr:hypothetical protein TIFTF001_018372 [Ficus carica]
MNMRHNKIQDLLSDVHRSAQTGEAVGIGKAAFKTTLNLLSTTFFSMDLTDPNSNIVRGQRHRVEHHGRGWKTELGRLFSFAEGRRRRMTIYLQKIIHGLVRPCHQPEAATERENRFYRGEWYLRYSYQGDGQ